jgi:hypothetical protein
MPSLLNRVIKRAQRRTVKLSASVKEGGFAQTLDKGKTRWVENRCIYYYCKPIKMNTKLPSGTLDKLWADSRNWRARVIYVCKDDPRFIVPKSKKWGGWTLNFAHASAWVALLVGILSIVIPAVCFAQAGLIGTWIWYAFLVSLIAILCSLCAILSSPKRFETAG